MSGHEAEALRRFAVRMQRAMLTTIANEFRARYEPAEGMPPAIAALLEQLEERKDLDPSLINS